MHCPPTRAAPKTRPMACMRFSATRPAPTTWPMALRHLTPTRAAPTTRPTVSRHFTRTPTGSDNHGQWSRMRFTPSTTGYKNTANGVSALNTQHERRQGNTADRRPGALEQPSGGETRPSALRRFTGYSGQDSPRTTTQPSAPMRWITRYTGANNANTAMGLDALAWTSRTATTISRWAMRRAAAWSATKAATLILATLGTLAITTSSALARKERRRRFIWRGQFMPMASL